MNNRVYRAGFASTQPAYEKNCRALFYGLDQLEERLTAKRYLFGNRIVETDWRLFCSLVRFDAVYYGTLNAISAESWTTPTWTAICETCISSLESPKP